MTLVQEMIVNSKLKQQQSVDAQIPSSPPKFIIEGPAGTGKSHVAKLIAETLIETNICPSTNCKIVQKANFEGTQGWRKYLKMLGEQVGQGVLVVDEIHDLIGSKNAQQALRHFTDPPDEDNPSKPIMILCGYSSKQDSARNVDAFLEQEPGLKRRFADAHRISLPPSDPRHVAEVFFQNVQAGHQETEHIKYVLKFTVRELEEALKKIPKRTRSVLNTALWKTVFHQIKTEHARHNVAQDTPDNKLTKRMLKDAIENFNLNRHRAHL